MRSRSRCKMKPSFGSCCSACYSGGGVAVGTGDAFSGGFGITGEGTASGTTLRVGSGKAGALRLVLEFVFALLFSFAFRFAAGLASITASGETSAFAFAFALAFALALTLPPAGMPSSPFPVGDGPTCTG